MSIYMLNKSFNVVLLYNSENEVVGMSRVFMAYVDGKPRIIMDNIELNQKYKNLESDSERKIFRDGFFEYMTKYAEQGTGEPDSQVYYNSGDIHVPNDDLSRIDKSIDFIGEIHRDDVYINSAGCSYQNPNSLKDFGNITWLLVPRKK